MFTQLFYAFLGWFIQCINVLRHFVLDETVGLTLFHFFVFTIFASITIHIVDYIKQIQEVESTKDEKVSKGGRFK